MDSLNINDKAPDFVAKNQYDQYIKLHDFIGKKVILYFYPKDNTPGCTQQSCNLRDSYDKLIKLGFVILGVSVDSVKSHKNFSDKFSLPFHIISDEDKKIVNDYKVYKEKQFMGKKYLGIQRTTFLIDDNGFIKHIITKPDTKNHTEEILKIWK